MKKLVIGALALVAVSAMAVESANTVGYMDIKDENAEEGFNVICPTFTTVGYNTVTLGDIILDGDDVEERVDNLQIFDANGNAEYGFEWRGSRGWYDADEREYANDSVIDRATGVVIDSANGGITIRSVGEVCTNAVEITGCVEGFNVVGNPFPVAIVLEDVALTGDGVEERVDNLQIFDASGNAEYGFEWRGTRGWYDADEREYANDTVLPAGQGVIIDSANGDISVEIASPAALASI